MWWRDKSRRDRGIPAEDPRLDALERENTRLFADLEGMQKRFQRLARSVWRVQEDERRRLARELHDELGQALTALVHRLDGLPEPYRDRTLPLARQTLEDVRELSRLLRPPVLDDLGLVAALEWLARRAREDTGIDVGVRAPAELGPIDPDIETLLFRITQEAVTNAIKHAQAGSVAISLSRAGNQVELRIRDDGRGFDPEAAEHNEDRGVGLSGMRDRAELFGGSLAVSSAPGRGTTISATLALEVPDVHQEQPAS